MDLLGQGYEVCVKRDAYTPKETYIYQKKPTKKSSFVDEFLGAELQDMCQKRRIYAKRDVYIPKELPKSGLLRRRNVRHRDAPYVKRNLYTTEETYKRDLHI